MTSVPVPRPKSARSHQHGMAYAAELILQTCHASPDPFYLRRLRTNLTRTGIKAAVSTHDTPVLFGWLMEMLSYQGVSDAVAWTYMEQHGRITWADIEAALQHSPPCPKLKDYTALSGCGYSKGSRTGWWRSRLAHAGARSRGASRDHRRSTCWTSLARRHA